MLTNCILQVSDDGPLKERIIPLPSPKRRGWLAIVTFLDGFGRAWCFELGRRAAWPYWHKVASTAVELTMKTPTNCNAPHPLLTRGIAFIWPVVCKPNVPFWSRGHPRVPDNGVCLLPSEGSAVNHIFATFTPFTRFLCRCFVVCSHLK